VKEPKKYELNIKDLLQIPEDRFEDFIIDLVKWHSATRNFVKLLEELGKAINTPDAIGHTKMIWIDDGKHEGKIIINGIDKGSL
jgi:hypothetical protein